MERYYQPEIECASREQILAWQNERLVKQVQNVWDNVPYYRKKMEEKGLTPGDIKGVADLSKLPFVTKDDLREAYPYGLNARPLKDCVRIQSTSGTTGKRVVAFYTQHDLDLWEDCCARAIVAAGGTNEDVCHVSYGYGLFTGALGLHQGWEKVGASVVPISSGNTERQINLMRDFGVTALVATPSYAMYMCEVAEKMGALKDLKLRIGVFGAEGSTEEMRAQLEKRWGIIATENYGLSEIVGPGVAGECTCKCGMHINEDLFYCEIVDPATGEPLPDGELGELVITPLKKQALPLLRYRTHDMTRIFREPCACGRTTARMQKIAGRSDDMLIIRGVNVFPSQIESVLLKVEGIGPNYEIIVTRENYMDRLEVRCELTDARLLDAYAELEALTKKIRERLRVVLQIDAKVTLVSPNTLKRFEGKARRVTDLR